MNRPPSSQGSLAAIMAARSRSTSSNLFSDNQQGISLVEELFSTMCRSPTAHYHESSSSSAAHSSTSTQDSFHETASVNEPEAIELAYEDHLLRHAYQLYRV